MKLLVAAVVFEAITGGTALAQAPGAAAALPPPPAPTAPTAPTTPATPTAPTAASTPTTLPPTPAPSLAFRPPADPASAPSALLRSQRSLPVRTEYEWYGWKVLIADGATLGFALATNNAGVALGWVAAGPLVHAGQGNYGRSVASLCMRVALPILGATAGASSARGCSGDFCGLGAALGGGLAGVLTAEVIDLALATNVHEIAPPKPSATWTPVASVRQSSTTIGIAARF